jgi:putative hydrolase of the HAD superfamily
MEVLLFDLDETLYPRGAGVLERMDVRIESWIRERHGASEEEAGRLRLELWREHGTTLRGLMHRFAVDPHEYIAHVHAVELADLIRPDPALRELLGGIRRPKLIFTNAPRAHADAVLGLLGVADLFEAVIAIEDLAFAAKPDPAAYRAATLRARVDPRACCVVDDTHANVVAAARCDMHAIWVAHGRPHEPAVAGVRVIERLSELAALLGRDASASGAL